MTYFITIEELKQTTFNANLDNEYIAPALEEAQSIYLREIIGDLLYSSITNKIDSETLSGKYLTLVNQYIKPYLTYKVQSVIVIPLNNKTRNAGIINQYDQGFNTSTMKDTAYLADYYNSRAEFYANRLTTYLQKNAADFPEYGYSDDNITQPTETQNVTTIYLGGGRKKGCGCNTTPQATATTVEWDNITNRPDFATVATSGDYEDLSNKPTIPTVPTNVSAFTNDAGYTTFDGDYNSLTNKPTIPVVPTNVSAFTNDAGYLTQHQSLDGYATESWVQEQGFSTFSGSYEDLTDKPSIPTVNDALLTIKQGGVVKGTFSANANENVEINLDAGGGGGSTDWSDITNKPNFATVATSGDYDDLQNKPTIPTVPTNVSAFTNDAGYTTFSGDYNDLTNKPTIPAAQVNSDWNASTGVAQILNKPSLASVATSGNYSDLNGTPSLATVATSGDYDDLQNKPTIPVVPTNVSAFTNDAGYTTFDGDYNSLTNKPSIPAAQVNSDWNSNSGVSQILNKPTLATVATTGSYNDLTDKPTIPTQWFGTQQEYDAISVKDPNTIYNIEGSDNVQSDWNQSDSSADDYIKNKPSIPAAQVQTDWNANSGMGQLLNKPSMTSETWTFTVDDGQGGTTTVTKTVWLQPTV